MSQPSSRPPAGVPGAGGNLKYGVLTAVLLLGIIAILFWRNGSKEPAPPPSPAAAAPTAAETAPANPKIDDVPPPPPVEEKPESGAGGPKVIYVQAGGCDGKCGGAPPPELAQALQVRGAQARRCYNEALARDSSLRGHVSLAVRIGTAGNVCSVNVASNDMGTPAVANCAARILGAGSYPTPRGGCVDATVPLAFVPQGQ
jgi:hypothetical protein